MPPYKTIAARAQDEFEERRSRFIGTIAPVTSEEQAVDFINEMKSRYKDANHNVYAYALRQGQLRRFSDDGEPQGTGGKPMLEVLLREELVDVAAVVTRYFGGVLLGAGGLTRAYTHGAKCAVDAAQVLIMHEAVRVELDIAYDFYGKVQYILPDYEVVTEDSQFGDGIRLVLRLKQQQLAPFSKRLLELSAGVVSPFLLEQLYAPFDN